MDRTRIDRYGALLVRVPEILARKLRVRLLPGSPRRRGGLVRGTETPLAVEIAAVHLGADARIDGLSDR
jgi:hypothetical protein